MKTNEFLLEPAQTQKFNAKPVTQPKKLAVTESKDNDILNLWKKNE